MVLQRDREQEDVSCRLAWSGCPLIWFTTPQPGVWIVDKMSARPHLRSVLRQSAEHSLQEQINDLECLLAEQSRNVFVFGEAGFGKTTAFFHHVAEEWAQGRLWRRQFLALFRVELCRTDVQKADSMEQLLEIILSPLLIPKRDVPDILTYLADNSEQFCFVLDGVDECDLAECSRFICDDLLQGSSLSMLRTVVTGRPTAQSNLVACVRQATPALQHHCVKLLGFSPAGFQEYATLRLGTQGAKELHSAALANPAMSNATTTPLLAALLCELFTKTGCMPKCLTDLLDALCLQAVNQAFDQYFLRLSDIGVEHSRALSELGRFALAMLHQGKYVFSHADLLANDLSVAAKRMRLLEHAGLEMDQTVLSEEQHQYRFCHGDLQEFIAARFCTELLTADQDSAWHFLSHLLNALKITSDSTQAFWMFLIAQVSRDTAAMIMDLIIAHGYEGRMRSDDTAASSAVQRPDPLADFVQPTLCALNDVDRLAESLQSFLAKEEMVRLANKLLGSPARAVSGTPAGHRVVENHMSRSREPTDFDYLRTLLTVWAKSRRTIALGNALMKAMEELSPELAARCQPCLMPASSMPHPFPQLSAWRTTAPSGRTLLLLADAFKEFIYHQPTGDCLAFECLGTMLRHNPLHTDLIGRVLSPANCFSLSLLLQHHGQSLQELFLVGSHLGDYGLSLLAPGLEACSVLERLVLANNSLTCSSLPTLAGVVRARRDTLISLDLKQNDFAEDGDDDVIADFVSALKACTSLVLLQMPDEDHVYAPLQDFLEDEIRFNEHYPLKELFYGQWEAQDD